MARAKRTARAEARRRYRTDQGPFDTDDTLEPDSPSSTPSTANTTTARTVVPQAGARRSIGAAFRESFHPLDIRADLRLLPTLIRHRAFWLPTLLTLASTAIFAAVRPGTGPELVVLGFIPLGLIATFLFQYFIVTPGIGAVFIAGFLAKRASWLIGALVGVVSAACYSFLGLAGFIPIAPGAAQPVARDVVVAAFALSPVLGALFASAAAWYRRFLTLSNPNRGRAASSKVAGRPDGRSRAAASKAGVRR